MYLLNKLSLMTTNFFSGVVYADENDIGDVSVGKAGLGFHPPSFGQVLTFLIRTLFIVGGLAAILYLMLGALAWITSGGDKEKVTKAREKIQAAIIGLILMFALLGMIVLLENVLNIGLGIGKEIEFPKLIN